MNHKPMTVILLPILGASILGLFYAFFFVNKDPVLMVIFGLQTLRGGLAYIEAAKNNRSQ